MPFMMQMDSKTSLTSAGGFCIAFNSVMSAGFKVSRAAKAASNAGRASARSPSQSSCKRNHLYISHLTFLKARHQVVLW